MNDLRPFSRARAEYHVGQVFAAQSVERGAVIRRKVAWVEREIGRQRFELEVRRRGFHLIETGGQFVVICNSDGLKVIR